MGRLEGVGSGWARTNVSRPRSTNFSAGVEDMAQQRGVLVRERTREPGTSARELGMAVMNRRGCRARRVLTRSVDSSLLEAAGRSTALHGGLLDKNVAGAGSPQPPRRRATAHSASSRTLSTHVHVMLRASARLTCSDVRDVLDGSTRRREAAPSTLRSAYNSSSRQRRPAAELCALEYPTLPADMCDSREYDAQKNLVPSSRCAPGSTPTLANCAAPPAAAAPAWRACSA